MSVEPIVWIVAALEILAALGIAVYWITWFRQPHDEPWLPDGYVEHETPFVYADAILAAVLVTAAVLQVTAAPPGEIEMLIPIGRGAGRPIGDSLGLVAAGMLAFLGVLDLAYFARTGLFKREHGGIVNGGVVIGVLLLAAILLVRFV
ncbi:MAG: hypothetical protein U9N78_11725 [Actinomycetota bacterium]|nr:hypothetical protein [Actinomycetota bacterium]